MARQYFPKPPSSLATEEYILAKQLEKQNQPTMFDRTLIVASEALNSAVKYKAGQDALQREYRYKEAMRKQEDEKALLMRGYREYTPDKQYQDYKKSWRPVDMGNGMSQEEPLPETDFLLAPENSRQSYLQSVGATPRTIDVGGKKWLEPEAKKQAPNMYTAAAIVQDPPNMPAGYYEQRNVVDATTGETRSYLTSYVGTPLQVRQQEQAIKQKIGELNPMERAKLQSLRDDKKNYYDPLTGTYDIEAYNKHIMRETEKWPNVRLILGGAAEPIPTGGQNEVDADNVEWVPQ